MCSKQQFDAIQQRQVQFQRKHAAIPRQQGRSQPLSREVTHLDAYVKHGLQPTHSNLKAHIWQSSQKRLEYGSTRTIHMKVKA